MQSSLREYLIEFESNLKIKETGKYLEVKKIFEVEIERLESLLNLKSFQIEVLEHNIDLLDSNYRTLLETFDISGVKLLKLPESLKPTIDFPEFKVIPADEGQELGKKDIKLDEIFAKSKQDEINQDLNNPNL